RKCIYGGRSSGAGKGFRCHLAKPERPAAKSASHGPKDLLVPLPHQDQRHADTVFGNSRGTRNRLSVAAIVYFFARTRPLVRHRTVQITKGILSKNALAKRILRA